MKNTSHSAIEFNDCEVTVNNKRLTARITGSGTPMVLFHSLLADQSSFELIVAELATKHRVVLLNLPGFADSEFVGPDIASIADHIAEGIQKMGIEKPILLGNGYGGFIVLQLAIRHPNFASRLVLADCGAAFSKLGRAAFRGMSAAAKEKGLIAIADVAMRRLFSVDFQQKNPALTSQRKERFLTLNPQTFHGACDALATLDLRQDLHRVMIPVLILVGDQDEATPPPMSHELSAGLEQAELVTLAGCAHVPQLQAPNMFMMAINTFIDDQTFFAK